MKHPRTYFVTKTACPHCGYEMDAASPPDGGDSRGPEPGDAGVCFKCTGLIIYQDRFTLRAPTPEEEKKFLADDRVREAQRSIRDFRAAYRGAAKLS